MQIGRFFSLQRGRVGQFLSPRVLVVRKPFRSGFGNVCYFGFDRLSQAQKFAQYLAASGYTFQLRRSQMVPQSYEVELQGHSDLARTLAYWERLDDRREQDRIAATDKQPGHSAKANQLPLALPAIAA